MTVLMMTFSKASLVVMSLTSLALF